nr:EOG090X02D0 [Lepidurus arcticus]
MSDLSTRRRKPQKSQICRLVVKDPPSSSQDSPLNLCLKDSDGVVCHVTQAQPFLPAQICLEANQDRSVLTSFPIPILPKDDGCCLPSQIKPNKSLRQRKPRSALFVPNSITPSTKLNNEVSIGKFKFVGGRAPSLTEKKMLHVDGRGNLKFTSSGNAVINPAINSMQISVPSPASTSINFDPWTFMLMDKPKIVLDNILTSIPPQNIYSPMPQPVSSKLTQKNASFVNNTSSSALTPTSNTTATSPMKFINYKPCDSDNNVSMLLAEPQTPESRPLKPSQYILPNTKPVKKLPKLIKLDPGNVVNFTKPNNPNVEPSSISANTSSVKLQSASQSVIAGTFQRKRKQGKVSHREQLESKFKEKGFLIKTEEIQANTGATFCKFRQLRKFTRYLYRSWKQYLPESQPQ